MNRITTHLLNYEIWHHDDLDTTEQAIKRAKDYSDAMGIVEPSMSVVLMTKIGAMQIHPDTLESDLANTWCMLVESSEL